MGDIAGAKRIDTGSGATPGEIAAAVVNALKSWKPGDPAVEPSLWAEWWDQSGCESIEADGSMFIGREGLDAKCAWWDSQFEIVRFEVEGPFVGATGFSLVFSMDAKHLESGDVKAMQEVGVYTVKDGKIVREEFMYRA